MNDNGNGYFGNLGNSPDGHGDKKPRVYGWVWVLCIISLVLTIIGSYATASLSDGILGNLGAIVGDGSIEDKNGPDDTSLCVLNFRDMLYYFDNEPRYNRFDSPCAALSYTSNAKTKSGVYFNEYPGLPVTLKVNFVAMNYYDVCYVRVPGDSEGDVNVRLHFSSELKSGNLEAVMFRIPEKYTGATTSDGLFLIDSACISAVAHFTADETLTADVVYSPGYYYIFVVAAEGATGKYSFGVAELI